MKGASEAGSEVVFTVDGRDVTRAELERDIEAKVKSGELRRYRVSIMATARPGLFLWDRTEHREVCTGETAEDIRAEMRRFGITAEMVDYL